MKPGQEGRRLSGTDSRDGAQAGSTGLRGPRAAVFAVVCVYAALGMHLLAGGPGARLEHVAAATAATGAGAFLLARRRRSPATLAVAAFAAQYGMHRLFSAGAAGAPAAHEHALHQPALHEHVLHHEHGGLSAGLGMVAAHLAVAVLSAWWLDRGETALGTFLLLLAGAVRGLWHGLATRLPLPEAVGRGPVTSPGAGVRAPQVLAGALCRRGPPAALAE
ncbi:hypothetical protein [Nonomuraea sp. NPDC050783]|uniref:hypothetical protein n=1 Tax=Nonomuraea sp. NPDC050783 TaxID=3154634 RepID=UPI003465BCB3